MDWDAVFTGAAIAVAVCGVLLLQAAWRARTGNGVRLAAGWGALFVSLLIWSQTSGADKGVALGVASVVACALGLLAWIAINAPQRPERDEPNRQSDPEKMGSLHLTERIVSGLLIGPVAGLSALALSTTVYVGAHRAGAEPTANATAVFFLFPLAWAGLSVLAGMDRRVWRKAVWVLGTGLAPLAYLAATS